MFDRTMVRGLLATAFVAVLLASVSNAWAGDITYNIVDYPAYETDIDNGGLDSISGTIVTDGNTGVLSASDIVGGTLTITSPSYGPATAPIASNKIIGGLWATPTALEIGIPASFGDENYLQLNATALVGSAPLYILSLNYYRSSVPFYGYMDTFSGSSEIWTAHPGDSGDGNQTIASFGAVGNNVASSPYLDLGGTDPWVIATAQSVPEPTTLSLLASAFLAVKAVYLRRRRSKA